MIIHSAKKLTPFLLRFLCITVTCFIKRFSALRYRNIVIVSLSSLLCFTGVSAKVGSKIIGSSAVIQIEGSSGSGLLPWATIAGYAEKNEKDINVTYSYLDTNDYNFDMKSLTWGWNNRLEISLAKQKLDLVSLGPMIGKPNAQVSQTIYGMKIRLLGNELYTTYPQLSIGFQYKKLADFSIPSSVGALDDSGIDFYLSATKLFLSQPFGFNGFATFNTRFTKANETGLLGFGGNKNNNYRLLMESSIGLFLKNNVAIGVDFRQKKSNLNFSKESHWKDVFIAWLPNKNVSLTFAYADLGTIATQRNQKGLYVSISGVF